MKTRALCLFLMALFCQSIVWGADPTSLRVWTSTKGTKLVARAQSVSGGMVTLAKRGGGTVTLKLSELSVQDQLIIKNHFSDEVPEREMEEEVPEREDVGDDLLDGDEVDDAERFDDLPEEFNRGLGRSYGPIKAAAGSSYYIYLPTTMIKGQKAPLLFWTGHHTGNMETLNFLIDGSELTGMVLATSVESRSGGRETHSVNLEHTKECLRHISMRLPVETKWTFFSGNDRGGASAFYNADRFRCAGAFIINGYVPRKTHPSAKGYYFVASGTTCHNRYRSAYAVNQAGKYGVFFPYPGSVSFPESHVGTHGLIWLYTRHLYSQRRLRSDEVRIFEGRFKVWLANHADLSPWETYYFTDHLLKTCDVEGEFRDFVLRLQQRLREEPDAEKYLEGRRALARFAEKTYAGYGGILNPLHGHTTPKIQNEVKKLADDYGEVPDLARVINLLAHPTNGN